MGFGAVDLVSAVLRAGDRYWEDARHADPAGGLGVVADLATPPLAVVTALAETVGFAVDSTFDFVLLRVSRCGNGHCRYGGGGQQSFQAHHLVR